MCKPTEDNQMSNKLKDCVSCKQPIRIDAIRCFHCGIRQDWLRKLDFGNSFLALVVALISVLSFSVPKFIALTEERKTEIIVQTGVYTRTGGLPCYARNTGNKPGLIYDSDISFQVKDADKPFAYIRLDIDDSHKPILLDGGRGADFILSVPKYYSDAELTMDNLFRKGWARKILKANLNSNLVMKLHLYVRAFDGKTIVFETPHGDASTDRSKAFGILSGKISHVPVMFSHIKRSIIEHAKKSKEN